MSLPPQTIRVKRKATEDAPVSYLRLQETKRQRSEVFVYQRQDQKPDAPFAHDPQRPTVHISQPKDARPKSARSSQNQAEQSAHAGAAAVDNGDGSKMSDVPDAASAVPAPRRFHMSRPDPYPTRVSKKRGAPALFVERRIKRISAKTVQRLHNAAADAASSGASAASSPAPASAASAPRPDASAGDADMDVDAPAPRKLKKPGASSKVPSRSSTPKPKSSEVPASLTDRWNVNMEKLTDDMNAYALEQIGLNLRQQEEESQRSTPARAAPQSPSSAGLRYKPKAPAKRFADRHPEDGQAPDDKEMVDAGGDADEAVSESDDEDYIIETYVRVPVSKMDGQVQPENVGLLVFDAEPDADKFYGEGSDSEDEWAEDDEDENAENYYTADYPDDEVASDDEYNYNAYAYRNGNASDLEEYDVDDSDTSSVNDKDDAPGRFRAFIGKSGLRSNHL